MSQHISIFTGDLISARRFKNILEDAGIGVILKEDKIIGYEITSDSASLFVLNEHSDKAKKIISEVQN